MFELWLVPGPSLLVVPLLSSCGPWSGQARRYFVREPVFRYDLASLLCREPRAVWLHRRTEVQIVII